MSISLVLSIFLFNSIIFRIKSLSVLLEIKAQSSMNTDKIKALMYMTKGENETMMEFHLNSMFTIAPNQSIRIFRRFV